MFLCVCADFSVLYVKVAMSAASCSGLMPKLRMLGSGDHYLDWGAFSHRLFSQAPSKEKGKRKGNTVQNKTERRNDVKVKTCI